MLKSIFTLIAGLTISATAAAQTYNIECVAHQPEGYPSFSADVSGQVTFEDERVTGVLNMNLIRNVVGRAPEVTEVQNLEVVGSMELVGGVTVINIKGSDTTPADVAQFIKLAIVPQGSQRTLPNGGFIRTTYGYYRPHHCTLN